MSVAGVMSAPVTVGLLTDQVETVLANAGFVDATPESRDLVAAVAGKARFWPRSHRDEPVDVGIAERAHAAAARRAMGMPFAYAVRRAAFRHLTLDVNEHVLIPRQETELLVDLVLQNECSGVVADVGTGSGAIAIALATEGQFARVIGTDVSSDAISVARGNAAQVGSVTIDFRTGDLLAPIAGERLDVLVSNPPYIAFDEAPGLPTSVRNWEPSHALFSGGNGLDATRRIVQGAPTLLCSGGLLALEVDSRRALQVTELVASSGSFTNIQLYQDLMGRDRFVLATRA